MVIAKSLIAQLIPLSVSKSNIIIKKKKNNCYIRLAVHKATS